MHFNIPPTVCSLVQGVKVGLGKGDCEEAVVTPGGEDGQNWEVAVRRERGKLVNRRVTGSRER